MVNETDRQKAERYLRMATETAAQAQRSGDPEVAEAYLALASVWLRMSEEIGARTASDNERRAAESQDTLTRA